MAETQLWTAAFIAFIAVFATAVMALLRSLELSSPFAKAVCWAVPVLGLTAMAILLYEAFLGAAGGYRGIAQGLISTLLYTLVPLLLLGQIIGGALARKADDDPS